MPVGILHHSIVYTLVLCWYRHVNYTTKSWGYNYSNTPERRPYVYILVESKVKTLNLELGYERTVTQSMH